MPRSPASAEGPSNLCTIVLAGSMSGDSSEFRYEIKGFVAEKETDAKSICWQNRHMLGGWVKKALRRGGIGQAELSRRLSNVLKMSVDRAAVNKMLTGERGVSGEEML